MASYDVVLRDRTTERIDAADAYQQEGQMTTFFALGEGRRVVDCWSTRLASFRTSEILIVRRTHCDERTAGSASDLLSEQIADLTQRRSA